MRIRALILSVTVAAALAAPIAASADYRHLACNGTITATQTPAGLIYTDDRTTPTAGNTGIPGVDGAWWLYLETNGHEGLQTGGEHAVLGSSPTFDDDCKATHGVTEGRDSILF